MSLAPQKCYTMTGKYNILCRDAQIGRLYGITKSHAQTFSKKAYYCLKARA